MPQRSLKSTLVVSRLHQARRSLAIESCSHLDRVPESVVYTKAHRSSLRTVERCRDGNDVFAYKDSCADGQQTCGCKAAHQPTFCLILPRNQQRNQVQRKITTVASGTAYLSRSPRGGQTNALSPKCFAVNGARISSPCGILKSGAILNFGNYILDTQSRRRSERDSVIERCYRE